MRRNIGSALAIYPMPVTVIGAMNGDEPTWTLVAHVGIIGHDRVTVSLAAAHFINKRIKEAGRLSVNLASEPMLSQVAVAGAVSGAKQSKAVSLWFCQPSVPQYRAMLTPAPAGGQDSQCSRPPRRSAPAAARPPGTGPCRA